MPQEGHGAVPSTEKANRHEALAVVAAYHREQLRSLLDHVRAGFDQLDAGEIDEFELDDLLFRYKKATKNLWVFCEAGGGSPGTAAAIAAMRGRGEERDWWAESARRRDRS